LHLKQEILLPRVEGRLDHLSVDVKGERLFVAALGNGSVEVIDVKRGSLIREIRSLHEPQGVLYEATSNRIFVASAGDGTLRSYDGTTFQPLKTIHLGEDADNLRYDSSRDRVFVGFGSGGLASFDTDLDEEARVALPAHPESFQLEQIGPRVFVNVPDRSEIVVVDRKKQQLIAHWRDLPASANFPMALDEADHRLFAAFRHPATLAIFNTTVGKMIAHLPVVGDADDLFYDSSRRLIYAIGGEGFMDVFRQQDADRYFHYSRIATAEGARTGLFVPALNRLFVAAPHRGQIPARILVYEWK
jgi:DNA-binding beta-propeller fold protein YncE